MKKYEVLVVIPAFNEEKTIISVIREVKKHSKKYRTKIVVINDGSTDKTGKIAIQEGVILLNHIINRGLGATITTGLEYAKDKSPDITVTLDADGQHDASNIPRLIEPIIAQKADVTIGSRMLKGSAKMPIDRLIVNKFANFTTYLLTGVYSSDSQSGLRAFSKTALNSLRIVSQRMEVSSEIFKEIKRNKLTFFEVPIDPIYTHYSLKKGQSILNAPNVLLKLALSLMKK